MAGNKQFLDAFNIGETISFQVYPADIYGSNFKNMKVTDVVSASTASRAFNFDAMSEHAKVLSDQNIPVGQIPQSYDSYLYVVLQPPVAQGANSSAQRVVLGLPWLIANTISVISTRDAVAYIPDINDQQLALIRQAISQVVSQFTLDYK